MKKQILFFIVLVLLFNCKGDEEDNAQRQPVRFALHLPPISLCKLYGNNERGNGSTLVAKSIEVTIVNSEKKEVYHRKSLPLSADADGYFSSAYLALAAGGFKIVEFWVKNQDNQIIYACPRKESSMAHYIQHPLPFDFVVSKNSIKNITLEVLPFDESMLPKTFGYTELAVKYPFSFSLAVIDDVTQKMVGGHVKITPSENKDVILYDEDIQQGVQLIVIENAEGYDQFDLIISKEGYKLKTHHFTKQQLNDFRYPNMMIMMIQATNKSVFKGDYIIENKDNIEKFRDKKYNKITGNLIINGLNYGIDNLKGLESLKSIGGALIITSNSYLKSLKGLDKLTSIGGREIGDSEKDGLHIEGNDELKYIKSLHNLTSIKNGVLIYNNDQLKSLEGLEGLKEIGLSKKEETTTFNIFVSLIEESTYDPYYHQYNFLCPLKKYFEEKEFEKVIIVRRLTRWRRTEKEEEYQYDKKGELLEKYADNCVP